VKALEHSGNVDDDIDIKVDTNTDTNVDTNVDANVEVTLEANPSDLTEEKLKGFLQAGVNRISMGFQVR
jgi:coproporphyrinogen III oxidase-like Fe-S oxidoreductase